uniref:Cytochrome P450 86B1-like n=1 Tax=Cucumis melo TaxID=3656 RepID=A0A9I9DV16_CUCME
MLSSVNLTAISSGEFPSQRLVAWKLFFLPDIQMLEIFIAIFIFTAIRSLRQRRKQGLPVWPVVGMLPSLVTGLRSNLYEWITEVLYHQNGTFRFKGPWFSSLHCVVTSDPRNIEHILKTEFLKYPKGSFFRETVHDLLGDGIFNADGEIWHKQRKTTSIEFHSAKFRQLTVESLHVLVHSRLLPIFDRHFVEHLVPIDLQDILLRLTFDNVCMIAFGVDPGCLSPNLPAIPFANAFEVATEATVLRFVTPQFIWKTMRYFNLGTEKSLKFALKEVNEFAMNVIEKRRREKVNEIERSDLLSVFMGLKDENGEPYSDKFLKDICVNFILAGRDTSSVALSWFFWLIDGNPEVEERILEEIFRILKKRGEAGEGSSAGNVRFEVEEIKKMEYLEAAISEALRLFPSVPVDHKEVIKDDVLPDGTQLKKGTKPERWLKDGRFMTESAYRFTPFNGGPRLCLGKDFAYYQMKYISASIILRYRVKVAEKHLVVPKLALTMYMKYGLKVNLFKRDKKEIEKYF